MAVSVYDHMVAGRGGGRRWRIETDLRSFKQTVRLYRICAHSADMMEKELLVAGMAYNLVRAIMLLAAQRAPIDPRQLSFTYAGNLVLDSYPEVLAAPPSSAPLLAVRTVYI